MSLLQEFLQENPVEGITQEVIASPRFKDKEGNVLKFKVKPVSGEENGAYRQACIIVKAGKKRDVSFDSKKYNEMIVINHTIDPSFKDAATMTAMGAKTAEELLYKTLLAGEIDTLVNVIMNLSGYGEDINELIEEAKN